MNLRLIKGWVGSFLFQKIKFRTIVGFFIKIIYGA